MRITIISPVYALYHCRQAGWFGKSMEAVAEAQAPPSNNRFSTEPNAICNFTFCLCIMM